MLHQTSWKRLACTCCIFVVLLLASTTVPPAAGQDVLAGLDLLDTDPALTWFNFGVPGSPAIPADFFGPGSDPFTGTIALDGGQHLGWAGR